MSYTIYLSLLLMAATCCSLVMAYLCWKRRELPIAISYGLGLMTGAFYSFGYAFEIMSTSLEGIRFWLMVEYIGIPFGTVSWTIMVLQYTGYQALVRKWVVSLLLIVPLITFVAHYTNQWHHLFYSSMTLNDSEGFPHVVLEKGPLYKLHVAYSYSFFAIGMLLLIRMFVKSSGRVKQQTALMIVGSWGPYGFTAVYLSGIIHMPVDLSPFGFLISGIFFMWGIYEFNMLRLAPLALQKVFATMQDAVLVFDLDNVLISYNRSTMRVIEGIHRRWIGLPAEQILGPYPALMERIQDKQAPAGKFRVTDPSGSFVYDADLSYIADHRQRSVGRMLLLTDVTETVRHEERLLEHAKVLSELNEFKDNMFRVIAHDIRDPLAVLVNLIEFMEEDLAQPDDNNQELVEEMGQQIRNTFTLVESLLDWFRIQRSGMIFDPRERDLAQMAQENVHLLHVRSKSKQIRITSHIESGTMVYADKEMLDLIIRNLLSNAIKFTGEGGSIVLQAERSDGMMIVSVTDTGAGMADEQAKALLQNEYPLVSSTGTAGERGVGLGLALCKEFVRLNGGELWFESTPMKGSTFSFSIPMPPAASGPPIREAGEGVG